MVIAHYGVSFAAPVVIFVPNKLCGIMHEHFASDGQEELVPAVFDLFTGLV
jgi:hypothetical protein